MLEILVVGHVGSVKFFDGKNPVLNVNIASSRRVGEHEYTDWISAKIWGERAEKLAAHVAKGTLPVLVDFWAPWCGPCRLMAPAYQEAAGVLEPFVRVLKVDTERHQALAGAHGIRSIPTLMLLRAGKETKRVAGAMDARGIVAWAHN